MVTCLTHGHGVGEREGWEVKRKGCEVGGAKSLGEERVSAHYYVFICLGDGLEGGEGGELDAGGRGGGGKTSRKHIGWLIGTSDF